MSIKSLLISLVAAIAVFGEAQGQKSTSAHENARSHYQSAGRPDLSPLATVMEGEPNDDAASANPAELGDQAVGEVDPQGDIDFFSLFIAGGTRVDFDVDASGVGSPLDPILALFDTDGVTLLAVNDDFDGLDSRIQLQIPVDGVYYVAIQGFGGQGGAGFFYTINLNVFVPPQPGPGDPTTLFASGFASPWGMAFDAEGNLLIAELGASRIAQVSPDGSVSIFADGIPFPRGLAFDGFGDLLVASEAATIFKVSSDGIPNPFITGLAVPTALAVTREGDIWVADGGTGAFSRFNPEGVLQESFNIGQFAFDLAISPAGELYFSNGFDTVFKLEGGAAVPFIVTDPFLEGLAFDADGFLYVANGFLGQVSLYDPDGTPVHVPFARENLGGPINLVFGRDATGNTNSRLFAANLGFNLLPPFANGIVEMNPAGIRAPGWPVGPSAGPRDILLTVNTDDVDALPGEEFAIPVSLDLTASNEAAATYDVELRWNGGLLSFVDLDVGDFTTGSGTFVVNTDNAAAGSVHAVAAEPEGRGGGVFTLFTLRMAASHLSAGAEVPISVLLRELAGPLAENLRFRVLVVSPGICATGFGDVNGDGRVTGADAVQILRWIVGLPTVESFDLSVADVDADGEVGVSDIIEILRFLVGLPIPPTSLLGSSVARGCAANSGS